MNYVREIDSYIEKQYPELADRVIRLQSLDMEKSVANSDGAWRYSMLPRTTIRIALTETRGGEPIQVFDSFGGLGQFEDLFEQPSELFEDIDQLHEHLMRKAEGVYPQAGYHDCILDAQLAGILAHEAIGHTTEADLVLGGSVAGDLMGEQAASELVTLVDFAHTFDEEPCPVPIFVDDEGTEAEDVVLIEEGILKSYMHNKDTAQRFGVPPKGNARAYQYSDEPLIRMRNTAILPGNSTLDEMIESVEDGYYLMKPSNGQADTTSEFMFGVVLGYEIKNGRLGRAIKDTTISGVAFDMLKTVTMISGEMNWSNSGMCGKKQLITVGMGGPAIKCRVNIGGK
jgi:TldD protein